MKFIIFFLTFLQTSELILANTGIIDLRYTIHDPRFPALIQASTINCQPRITRDKLPTDLDRAAFYKAMESESKTLVDEQISELNTAPADVKNAFLGAMMMRKAGIGGNPASKLKLFKQGRALLEGAIAKDPDNAEFRFLRLIIQENAPGVLGYKNDIQKDIEFIRKSYHSMPEDLQKTIADYNKKSKVLKLQVS
ncbi:MAG TPA: hypothetical protein VFI33_03580 [Puia sp.]|nr:hypothetical protein [Puia sp.]